MEISTGSHCLSSSGSANCLSLVGSIKRKKYQQLPAHCGIVFVSRRPFIPVFGSVTLTQSLLAKGDSPVPEGLISSISGSSNGKSSSGTADIEPSSQWIIGIGSPQ